jgi:hypothetical protein
MSDALAQAQEVADYQTIGVRSREALLAFISAAQTVIPWTSAEEPPKKADLKAWGDHICNVALPGASHEQRRHLYKTLLESAWKFTNWLTHAKFSHWHDAEAAIEITQNAIGLCISAVIRFIRGVPDQFLGWAAFHRGFGNPRRPVPLRMIAINPNLGPAGDGGHLWATTATMDGSETNQALFIPKGWGGYFHFPLAQNVGDRPTEGLAVDRVSNRVYVASGLSPGVIAVIGDHTNLCTDAFTKIVSLEDSANQLPVEDTDQIGVEFWENKEEVTQLHSDVNGDSIINVLDLAFVATRYGSSDPTADLNTDGQVDIMDLAIIAENFRP